MDEIFKIESTGKGSKRRWSVWKYRVVDQGVGEKAGMPPENRDPFHSSEAAIAFPKRTAPNQPE